MNKRVTAFLSKLAMLLELFISIMLAIGIILLCFRLASSLMHIPDLEAYPNYEDLLESCFNLIIGVELIRMMYYHTPDTVFEVLLFAIARQVIVDHSSALSSLIGVAAIAVLFATRKYLFCGFDLAEKSLFRGSSKIRTVNKIMQVEIPYQHEDDTLAQVMMAELEKDGIRPKTGTCVYLDDIGLKVEKMKEGKISRIEVIHAIH